MSEQYNQKVWAARTAALIAALDYSQFVCMIEYYGHKKSVKEIAALRGMSPAEVDKILKKAVENLVACLGKKQGLNNTEVNWIERGVGRGEDLWLPALWCSGFEDPAKAEAIAIRLFCTYVVQPFDKGL